MANPVAAGAAAPNPTVEQPGGEPGRGDVDHLSGLYDLTAHPEELRGPLEQELRKINAGIGRRFQEHADFRQRFEPLAGIEGLTDVPSEDLEELVALRAAFARANDENSPNDKDLYEWWDAVGEHFGFFGNDGGDGGEPADNGDGEQAPAWAQQLSERLERMEQRQEHGEQQSRETSANAAIERKIAQVKAQHKLDDDAEARVLQLALAYQGQPDAIDRGLADYFAITGRGEASLLNDAGEPKPGGSLNGGQPAAANGEPMRFDDPRLKQAALARLKGQNASGGV